MVSVVRFVCWRRVRNQGTSLLAHEKLGLQVTLAEQDGRFVSLYILELLYKLKMYQEVEIPNGGKHSMSQDLPVFFFFIIFFLFLLLLSICWGFGFSAFLARGQNTYFQDTRAAFALCP